MWHLHSLPAAYSCMCCAKNVYIYESSLEEWKPHSKTTFSTCLWMNLISYKAFIGEKRSLEI